MQKRIETLKREYASLHQLSKDENIDFGSPLHRSIMIEMGKIKLQIMSLSAEVYQQYRTK